MEVSKEVSSKSVDVINEGTNIGANKSFDGCVSGGIDGDKTKVVNEVFMEESMEGANKRMAMVY
ncbi:hypothetical protein MA16_Dca016156 [Dendrobium catenatum]|uniref:Uncharacterized protein n=1 Tax=Dendrobium catenatum TaxID=906689 RepID=A0A2I0WBQ8_9ASPA|nr:hypothetical protein MA16_Dca016156 [Dendrobium catenatum]